MIGDGPSLLRLATYVNGYPFKPDDLDGSGLPVIRIRQLLDPEATVDRTDLPVPDAAISDGDVVFSWSATLAVRTWDRGPGLLNQHLFRVDPRPGVDRRWLRYVLEVACDRLVGLMHGSAMTHVTRDMLASVRVPLPPAGTQRAIADYLDTETARLDTLIAKKRSLRETLIERFDVLVGQVFAQLDESSSRRVSSVAEVCLGRQRSPDNDQGPHMTTYLRAANVADGSLLLEDVKQMNFTPRERARFNLGPGDILMTEGSGSLSTVGAAAIWDGELPQPVCFQNTLLRLRPRTEQLEAPYLLWWCRFAYRTGLFAVTATGANIHHLSADGLSSLSLPVPPTHTQREIVARLDNTEAHVQKTGSAIERQLELLAEHRQALITAAVTSQIDVPGAAA